MALTFDDGYVDTAVHALPILERHGAPFTLYVTTGFADRRREPVIAHVVIAHGGPLHAAT